jgi:Galactose oxidase, central domain
MSFLDLPDDVLKSIVSHLDSPDLLQFLSTHRRYHEGLGQSSEFWSFMLGYAVSEEDARKKYMIQAYQKHIPAVKWHKISRETYRISPREGHLSCTFSDEHEERVCITGGFVDDSAVYVMQIRSNTSQRSEWIRLIPSGPTDFVYGASLTALDDTRAIRFGGFRAAGYSSECNIVQLLTVEKCKNDLLRSRWQLIQAQNPQFAMPRAYHSATLINSRYLLVLGGMTEDGCILSEALLDTDSWTWLDPSRITNGIALDDSRPSGRHGHSVVLDERRNRLVLFGGGSGTDILRSGEDNAEVWELKMGANWNLNLEASFPWMWVKIHRDRRDYDANEANSMVARSAATVLTPSEALCLGRCHGGVKTSPDTVLCLLGSGNPSTNGVVAFDLSHDRFVRPVVFGTLPKPRFTFACELLRHGHIIVHGGFCSQDRSTLGDVYVLDLAPYIKNREFMSLPVDSDARSHNPVTDEHAEQGRMSGERILQQMFHTLGSAIDQDRPALAQEMMGQLIANGQFGGQAFMLMRMFANSSAVVRFGGDSDSSPARSGRDDDGSDSRSRDESDTEAMEG